MMPDGRHPGFWESFGYAFQGLAAALRRERNLRVMLVAALLALLLCAVLRVDALSWAVVVLCIGAVLCAELLNTALEAVVDLASPDYHDLAKLAKDCASAGVYILSMAAAVTGCIIFVRAAIALFAG